MDPALEKRIPKVDEYDLTWVRHDLKVMHVEINQFKSLVVVTVDDVDGLKKDLHRCQVQRQADMLKIAELSMRNDDLEKLVAAIEERLTKSETRIDKASELMSSIRKDKADAKKAAE